MTEKQKEIVQQTIEKRREDYKRVAAAMQSLIMGTLVEVMAQGVNGPEIGDYIRQEIAKAMNTPIDNLAEGVKEHAIDH